MPGAIGITPSFAFITTDLKKPGAIIPSEASRVKRQLDWHFGPTASEPKRTFARGLKMSQKRKQCAFCQQVEAV
jgi:hypothetical protein